MSSVDPRFLMEFETEAPQVDECMRLIVNREGPASLAKALHRVCLPNQLMEVVEQLLMLSRLTEETPEGAGLWFAPKSDVLVPLMQCGGWQLAATLSAVNSKWRRGVKEWRAGEQSVSFASNAIITDGAVAAVAQSFPLLKRFDLTG